MQVVYVEGNSWFRLAFKRGILRSVFLFKIRLQLDGGDSAGSVAPRPQHGGYAIGKTWIEGAIPSPLERTGEQSVNR
jgi:hypothetical protein